MHYEEQDFVWEKEEGIITTTEEEKEENMKEMIAIIIQTL